MKSRFEYIYKLNFEDILKNPIRCYKEYNIIIDLFFKKEEYIEDDNTNNNTQYEVHHILPKCMGGKDELDNLVKLPIQFHIICHILLAFSYINTIYFSKLMYAANCMLNIGKKRKRILENDIDLKRIINNIGDLLKKYKKEIISKTIIDVNSGKIYKSIKDCSNELGISIYSISNELRKLNNGKFRYCNENGDFIEYKQKNSKKIFYVKGKEGIYKNIQECSKAENLSITCLHNRLMDPNNKIYYYCLDPEGKNLIQKIFRKNNSKKVITPDKTIYNSVSDCSNHLGISIYSIYGKIRNKDSGYSFCDDNGNPINNNKDLTKINKKRKLVKDLSTGIIYKSVKDCSINLNIKESTIYSNIKDNNKFSYCNENGELIFYESKNYFLIKNKISGKIYKNIQDCSKETNVSIYILYKYLKDDNSDYCYCDEYGNIIEKRPKDLLSKVRKIQRVSDNQVYDDKESCIKINKISKYKLDKELSNKNGKFRWI